MAKRSIWQRIKSFFTGGGGGGNSSSARRVVNNPTSRRVVSSNTSNASARRAYINAYKGERDDLSRSESSVRSAAKDSWAKTRNAFKASSSNATPDPKTTQRVTAKKDTKEYFKAEATKLKQRETPVDVKEQRNRNEGIKKKVKRGEQLATAAAYKPIVDKKYFSGTKEAKRRLKSGEYQSDPTVSIYEMAKHPNITTAARAGAMGWSAGVGNVINAKAPKSKKMERAEKYYQENKNKPLEVASEMAGTLGVFALTGDGAPNLVSKALPKTTAKVSAKATEKLAAREFLKNAARRELGKEATEEAVKKLAKEKAGKIVSDLGRDISVDLTTGAAVDLLQSVADSKNLKEFGKNMAKNAGLNAGLAVGSRALSGAVRSAKPYADEAAEVAGRKLKSEAGKVDIGSRAKKLTAERDKLKAVLKRDEDIISELDYDKITKRISEIEAELKAGAKEEPPRVKVDLGRKRKRDVVLPNERRTAESVVEETGIVPRVERAEANGRAGADEFAGATENAGAGEKTTFKRSNEKTAKEKARERRTAGNKETATQESFDRDFEAFTQKAAKASEIKERMRSASSAEERAALKSQLDELNAEIRRDYSRASLKYHPDRGGSNEWMGQFNNAFYEHRHGTFSGAYKRDGFRGATSSQRAGAEAGADAGADAGANAGRGNAWYERYKANEQARSSRTAEAGGSGGGTTPPPPGGGAAEGAENAGRGFRRPKGKAKEYDKSYVYKGEDTVFKRKDAPTTRENATKVARDARRRVVDSHASFEDEARKYAKTDPERMQDLYGSTDAHRRSGATATRSINDGQVNYHGDRFKNGKSLKDIYTGLNKEQEKAFDYYLYLKHAPARLREGTPIWNTRTLIDGRRLGDPEFVDWLKKNRAVVDDLEKQIKRTRDAEQKAVLQQQLNDLNATIKSTTDSVIDRMSKVWDDEIARLKREHPEVDFEGRAKDVYQYTQNELKNLVDAGIVSRDTAIAWSEAHPFYVPTHRDGYAGMAGSVHGPAIGASDTKAATGSDLDLRSIRDQLEEATRQNWEDMTLNDMLRDYFGDRIGKTASNGPAIDVDRAIENNISIAKSKDGTKFYADIFINGKKQRVEIDKRFVDDLADWNKHGKLGVDMFDVPNEALSKYSHVFKNLITELNPWFLLKNPMRDFPEAFINSRQSKEFMKNIIPAAKDLLTGGPYSEALRNAGISQASFFDLDRELLKESGAANKNVIVKGLGAIGDKISAMNQFAEMLPRLTEYMATFKKAGISLEDADKALRNRAASNAADVTVNFGRSGSAGKWLNKGVVPFFNPSVQGWSKFARNFSEQPGVKAYVNLAAKMGALGIGVTVMNNYFLRDNPNYQNISPRDKANNLIIPAPRDGETALTTDRFIRIPNSRFASVLSLPAVNAFNENKMGWADMIKVANDQVAPIDPIESNIFAPLGAVAKNETWYGTPIVPQGIENKTNPSQEYDANTSWFGRQLGKATENLPSKMQISPKKADYLIDAETGVIGDILLPLTTPSRQGGGKGIEKYGPAVLNTITKPFTIDATTQNNLSTRFYDQLQVAEDNKKISKGGEAGEEEYKRLNNYSTEIAKINTAVRDLQNGNRATKLDDIRGLQKARNRLMLDALDGKEAPSKSKTLDAVQKYVGTTYAVNNFGSSADRRALKVYGKAVYGDISDAQMQKKMDADKDFYKGVRAIGKLEDSISKAGLKGGTSTLAKSVALASIDADDKLFGAYKGTSQSRTESANEMDRARAYLNDGGSTKEFVRMEKNRKGLGKLPEEEKAAELRRIDKQLARGEITQSEYDSKEQEIGYNANISYVGLATSLAQGNAPSRGYALYDIKSKNAQKGVNLAAMGYSARDYRNMVKAADADGNGYLKTAEIRSFVANSGAQDKATLYDALYHYNGKYNPFGTPTKYTRDQAAAAGKAKGVDQISKETGDLKLKADESSSSGSGYRRRGSGRRRGGYRRGGGGSSKPVKTSVPIKASDFKASKATYKDAAKSLPTTSTKKSKASKPKTAKGAYSKAKSMNIPTPATTKVTPPKVKFKKYEI